MPLLLQWLPDWDRRRCRQSVLLACWHCLLLSVQVECLLICLLPQLRLLQRPPDSARLLLYRVPYPPVNRMAIDQILIKNDLEARIRLNIATPSHLIWTAMSTGIAVVHRWTQFWTERAAVKSVVNIITATRIRTRMSAKMSEVMLISSSMLQMRSVFQTICHMF